MRIKQLGAMMLSIAAAASADAGVIYTETGTLTGAGPQAPGIGIPLRLPGGNTIKVQFDLSADDISISGTFEYDVTVSLCSSDYERPECFTNEAYFTREIRSIGVNSYGFSEEIFPGIAYFGGGFLSWEYNVQKFDPDTFEVNPVDYRLTITDSAVPEPSSWALMIVGFGLLGAAARQRQRVSIAL